MAPRTSPNAGKGLEELGAIRRANMPLFAWVFVFSIFVNALMLTGPLYMLQVYDRVLGSQSEETLLALSVLVAFLFLMMGILDWARGRVLARAGARMQDTLDQRVFSASLRKSLRQGQTTAATGLRDLESMQRLLSSPALLAVFDIPWTPLFVAAIFMFHPWLGYLALVGGTFLILVTVLNQWLTSRPVSKANEASARAEMMSQQLAGGAETVESLGMRGAAFTRWSKVRAESLSETLTSSDRTGGFSTLTKTFRLFLQSAMLGLGAYLVLQQQLTAGAMIAGSILMGRALAPIEMAIGQWPLVQRAMKGRRDLIELLDAIPPDPERTPLPKPKARLVVEQLIVVPPGEAQAALRSVSFTVSPGEACGVIGQSGAGKSTLARALTGIWPVAGGKIRLDGAALDQFGPDVLGTHIGYLPQQVVLFDGTIAENIARLAPQPDAQAVVDAAKRADAHEMILKLPNGYDTMLLGSQTRLSGGQMQRIGLARALYGDPVLLVLDEPNSNLDNSGSQALNAAVARMKKDGKAVLIMAHRPAAIEQCDTLLVLEGGSRKAFGPRDEVLKSMVSNHKEILKKAAGGVS
ncbi:type I secretion system permease/ATPase [Dinoroseobacter sp. PD6]|uniref:type I secretion system permease/ATPase n=1 Tax=Dinoroseobacter sp. PD6 TaxID=3028384 RepID=UPI00237B6D18|nr:type I secretion system permease/ATPase [Dinoroseobacter sp. PD6]MDD9717271.1 type I secretion system permease/ATPase [Dinoroseobacter sp. PD6]